MKGCQSSTDKETFIDCNNCELNGNPEGCQEYIENNHFVRVERVEV